MSLTQDIKHRAHELGFDVVGISPGEPLSRAGFYFRWLDEGYAGEMGYLKKNLHKRSDPRFILADVRSIISVGMSYYFEDGSGEWEDNGPKGTISRYARGDDYHLIMESKLEELLRFIKARSGGEVKGKVYVDTGPVLEREVASRAGVGWFGKNTMLINTRLGSFTFLGEILVNIELEYDSAEREHCGKCALCLAACPTNAFVGPYVLDSRRCIAYLTIELKGSIPNELRPLIGNRIFGCDICQDVCPWNRKIPFGRRDAFRPRNDLTAPDLIPLMGLTEEEFGSRYRGSPIKRAKRRGFLRNVAVALGNSGDRRAVPVLVRAMGDSEPLVRGHAAWALGRVGGEGARKGLEEALEREVDGYVRDEIAGALMELDLVAV
jgi:epoxyqueuosine reductase